jgi:peptidoglycan hydrolase-like protein with peptidoglycan-binding domain
MGKPKQLAQTQLDLPDPSQYYKWDNSLYNQAREGVTSGIQGIRDRGNTAFDRAGVELAQYQNPYNGGLQTQNPDLQSAMQRMMSANGVNPGQVAQTNNEGIQADQAMRNTLAILAGTDQARQAANQRALAGDRTTFDQNLGLEGNMLNLGVNMSEAKGKNAFDQMLQGLMFDTAGQEATQNWQRGNTVSDTNIGNANTWNSGLMQTLLAMVGAKAPGTTLPAATGGFYA